MGATARAILEQHTDSALSEVRVQPSPNPKRFRRMLVVLELLAFLALGVAIGKASTHFYSTALAASPVVVSKAR